MQSVTSMCTVALHSQNVPPTLPSSCRKAENDTVQKVCEEVGPADSTDKRVFFLQRHWRRPVNGRKVDQNPGAARRNRSGQERVAAQLSGR